MIKPYKILSELNIYLLVNGAEKCEWELLTDFSTEKFIKNNKKVKMKKTKKKIPKGPTKQPKQQRQSKNTITERL